MPERMQKEWYTYFAKVSNTRNQVAMRKYRMVKSHRKAIHYPYYLWILGVYPILHLYSVNYGLVMDHELAPTITAMLIATTIIYVLMGRVFPDQHKRAFFLGIASLVFSTSGHVYSMIFMPRSLFVWDLATAAILLFLTVALHKRLPQGVYSWFTVSFNLTMAALLGMQIITLLAIIVSAQDDVGASSVYDRTTAAEPAVEKVTDSATRPDIYYIVPDGYPSDELLQRTMNYDNSQFTQALQDRGFEVVRHAKSNYATTLPSLASTLNMQYISHNPSPLGDRTYLRLFIADNAVAGQLQQLGYTYVQFLSGYLIPSSIADINRDFTANGPVDITVDHDNLSTAVLKDGLADKKTRVDLSYFYRRPFIPLYMDTTLLRLFHSQLKQLYDRDNERPLDLIAPQRFLVSIDEVESIVAMSEATFTVIHLMKPHLPTSFNEEGSATEFNWMPNDETFFAEFRFINSKFLQLIDTILDGSRNPPIILFQADHGGIYGDAARGNMSGNPYESYAAYYVPDPYQLSFPVPYTLVNSFPLILNEVFNTNYELQDDRLYELVPRSDLLSDQKDVTDVMLQN